MWGPFHVNGPKPVFYTKACELVGKGVGIGLVGLYTYIVGQLVRKPGMPNTWMARRWYGRLDAVDVVTAE